MKLTQAVFNVATGVVGGGIIYLSKPMGIPAVFSALASAVSIIAVLTFRRKIAGFVREIAERIDENSNRDKSTNGAEDLVNLEFIDEIVNNGDSSETPPVDFEFHAALNDMGIVTGARKLEDSKYEPTKVMEQTESELSFLGCFGTKWVAEGTERVNFESMLDRVESRPDENDSLVRFLLLEPNGEGFDKHRSKLKHPIGAATSHYQFYKDFDNDYDCFQVRTYDSLPRFRLILTPEYTAFSPYSYASESEVDSKQGWLNPHLEIDPTKRKELHLAFKDYYERLWENAKPLSEVENETNTNNV